MTPLHYATKKGHTKVVQKIVDHTNDINIPDKNGKTPLFYAVQAENIAICQIIVKKLMWKNYNPSISYLHYAAAMNDLGLYRLLKKQGEENNPPDDSGSTPLHIAAEKG